MNKTFLYLIACLFALTNTEKLWGQYAMGATGLLNIPTADMQTEGTFMTGANFLPESMTPNYWDYNTGNYFLNLTFLPFIEVTYRCTLIKLETDKWNQDRSVSLRLRAIKESRYFPSLVIGSNDALTSGQLNTFEDTKSNRYFSAVYAVTTKHFKFNENDLGITVGGTIPFKHETQRKGLFAGLNYKPAFLKQLSIMTEYDDTAFNFGLAGRFFNHFSAYLFCYDTKSFCGGISYELHLLKGEKK
ncbi:MAG: YjbH domain-containing protein [Massilibacteroides sp.]|nr:YjbH domain-containing protein [Massilibacteroides sp.]